MVLLICREHGDGGQLGVEDVVALREELDRQDPGGVGVVAGGLEALLSPAVAALELLENIVQLIVTGAPFEIAEPGSVQDEILGRTTWRVCALGGEERHGADGIRLAKGSDLPHARAHGMARVSVPKVGRDLVAVGDRDQTHVEKRSDFPCSLDYPPPKELPRPRRGGGRLGHPVPLRGEPSVLAARHAPMRPAPSKRPGGPDRPQGVAPREIRSQSAFQ